MAAALTDVVIVHPGRTRTVSLSATFHDPDSGPPTITAVSSNHAVATASAAADGSSLTVTAKSRGAATITVIADDGNGGTVSDDFRVTVKSAPFVSVILADLGGLEAGTSRDVSLSGMFGDHDGDPLAITASSSNDALARVSVASDGATLTLTGVAEGAATITVTVRDPDANEVSDDFTVSVMPAPQPDTTPRTDLPGIVGRYDADGDGSIGLSEYRRAVDHYNADRISYAELLKIVQAYLRR